MRFARTNTDTNLKLVAAFSAAVLLIVGCFAVVNPTHRTLSWLGVGLLAFAGLAVSLFHLFVRSVDERLFRVSEYQQRQASSQFALSTLQHRPSDELPST